MKVKTDESERHHRVAASYPFYLSRSVLCRNQQLQQQQRGNRFIRCARFLHFAVRSLCRYCTSVLRVVGRHGGLRDGEPVGYACTQDDRQATLQERLPVRSGSLHPHVWLAWKPGFLRRFKRRKFLKIVLTTDKLDKRYQLLRDIMLYLSKSWLSG